MSERSFASPPALCPNLCLLLADYHMFYYFLLFAVLRYLENFGRDTVVLQFCKGHAVRVRD
jgi:hypothetical protein